MYLTFLLHLIHIFSRKQRFSKENEISFPENFTMCYTFRSDDIMRRTKHLWLNLKYNQTLSIHGKFKNIYFVL